MARCSSVELVVGCYDGRAAKRESGKALGFPPYEIIRLRAPPGSQAPFLVRTLQYHYTSRSLARRLFQESCCLFYEIACKKSM